ncbi:interleukin-20 receptor subunit beta [Eucyclogobius newberryi]|uniref:interleukin-20 receptor subunit beta n=1 Tax=Eucyclogobius newberryi TaxID=166745 RepID=UPI003B5B6453
MAPGALLLLLLLLLLLGLCDGVGVLSAPSGLSTKSINMRHNLSWRPLLDQCDTAVLYSVQYQGDFERLVLNRTWLDAAHCQLISLSQCDLSLELSSDSDYNLRVRAHCGRVLSPWQQLVSPFNRNDTELLAPRLKPDVLGDRLLVSLEDVPHIYFVRVFLWRTRLQEQVLERVVRLEQVLFEDLQEGEEYCFQAQSELPSGRRGRRTVPQCVYIPGSGGSLWEMPLKVAFAVVLSVGFLCTVLWFTVHPPPQTCIMFCHKEALPQSLVKWDFSMPVQTQEEEEVFIVQVQEAAPPSAVALL